MISKTVSVCLTGVYIALAFINEKDVIWFFWVTYLVLPLGCIWQGEKIGSMAGLALFGHDRPSAAAGKAIVIAGWILLITPALRLMI